MKGERMRQSRLLAPLSGLQVRDSGVGDGSYTINGHAAVFNEWSCPLGWSGFLERVAIGAFERVLSEEPHVTSNWNHDDRWMLGSTPSGTLTLREDGDAGLEYWTRVAPTTYADDLRILIERGDISQCSFCFTIERETWVKEEPEDGSVQLYSTILEIGELYDVTVCAMGAYSQTDVIVTNNLASSQDRLERALREGRVPNTTLAEALERGLLPATGLGSAGTPEHGRDAGEGDAPTSEGTEGKEREGFNLAHARAHVASARARLP